jgi:hypothetical protein
MGDKTDIKEFENYFINNNAGAPSAPAQAVVAETPSRNLPLLYDAKDKLFLLISLVMGFLLFDFVLFEGFGIGTTAFLLIVYSAMLWYLSGRESGIEKKGLWLLIPIAGLAACFSLYDNIVLNVLDFMLLYALIVLQLASMTGCRLYETSLPGLVVDFIHAGIVLPLVNIPSPFKALRRQSRSGGKVGKTGAILLGVGISIPVLAVVLALLSSADQTFQNGLGDFFDFLGKNLGEYIAKIILGAIAAVPFFGLLKALRANRPVKAMQAKVDPDKVKVMDGAVAGTVMTLLCAVYVIFMLVQFGYLFKVFSNIKPPDLTYAGYARRGFFELMAVAVINLCVLLCSLYFSRRAGRGAAGLKALETALVALTLLLIASDAAKMIMYMSACGLTLMRVYVSWFLLLLAIFFVAILVKLYVKKFALAKFCFATFLILFLGLNFLNVDARVAQYNVDRYLQRKAQTVDMGAFDDLSDSMVPYAVKLLGDRDPAVAQQARELLESQAGILTHNDWQVFSAARQQAKAVFVAYGITYQPDADDMD